MLQRRLWGKGHLFITFALWRENDVAVHPVLSIERAIRACIFDCDGLAIGIISSLCPEIVLVLRKSPDDLALRHGQIVCLDGSCRRRGTVRRLGECNLCART